MHRACHFKELICISNISDFPSPLQSRVPRTMNSPGKDLLLIQTLVRFLKLFLDPFVHFLVESSFSKKPANSVCPEPPILDIWSPSISDKVAHPPPTPRWCLITLACLQQESHQIGSAKVLLTPMLPLTNFPSSDPTLLLGYKFQLAHVIFGLSSVLYWGFFFPNAMVLNNICFNLFNVQFQFFTMQSEDPFGDNKHTHWVINRLKSKICNTAYEQPGIYGHLKMCKVVGNAAK